MMSHFMVGCCGARRLVLCTKDMGRHGYLHIAEREAVS